jgi:tetratricopeptide (TPR) repeat protein
MKPLTQVEEWLQAAGDLNDQEKYDEAAEMASRVLMLEPNNYKALYCIGSVMLKVGRNVQAQQFLRRVAELMPRDFRSWGNLSISCAEMHRYEEAIQFAEKALALKKDRQTWADASFAHTTAGNWAQGRSYAVEALKCDPEFKDAQFHLANCDLAEQRWVEGWRGFKASEGTKWRKLHTYGNTVEWQGEPGAVVMVTGEQGLGDEVMMAGVIPDAIKACTKFIFDCDPRAHALFARSFPGAVVVPTRHSKTVALPVAPTHHKTLFGLAELFRQRNEDFPRKPYLTANPDYRRMFKALFAGRKTVGIAWSGGFPRTGQVERTAGLTAFLPLLREEPETMFVSLQYRDDAAEVLAFEQKTGCKVHRFPWVMASPDGLKQDTDLYAAFIAELDEVVGVHTTSLHIASALGVPTTTLTHRGSGWRYAPDEMLWYPPTTRLWKKDRGESWRECVGALVAHRRERMRAAA